MQFKKGNVDGISVFLLKKFIDERGLLMEIFRSDELPDGIRPEMCYISYTEPGVARGPHEHVRQIDIFSFTGPSNFKVKLWDNRKESKTYGNYSEIYGGEDNPIVVIVPPGIVHGYKNISSIKRGMVLNFPDKLYKGKGKKEEVDEIRHENIPDSPFHF